MDTLKQDRCIVCIAIILALVALGIAGSMDFDDARKAEQQYCRDVDDRVYPDYKGIYREVCE